MAPRRPLGLGAALLVAALVAALALSLPAEAGKGKGKGKGAKPTRTLSSGNLNLAVPDDTDGIGNPGVGVAQTTLRAGKRFKGLRIDDVDVSLRATHADIADLAARVTAPNGATTNVVLYGNTSGPTWGSGPAGCAGTPLTIDDEAPLFLTGEMLPNESQLGSPYAGRAQPPTKPLFVMDGGPARGVWTLTVLDRDGPGDVGALNCWKLTVRTRRAS